MIIGFNEVMQIITKDYKNMTEEIIQDAVYSRILKVYQAHKLDESLIPKYDWIFSYLIQITNVTNREKLTVCLRGYNSFGEEIKVDFKDTISFKLTPYFFMLRLELTNVTR